MLFVISLNPFRLPGLPPMVGKIVQALVAPEISFIKSDVAGLNFLVFFFEVENWRSRRDLPIHPLMPTDDVILLPTVPAEDKRIQKAFTFVTSGVILALK